MRRYPWPSSHHVSHEGCHALGVVVANWNCCEHVLEILLRAYLAPIPIAETLAASLPNNTKANLLADVVAATEKWAALRHGIEHFQRCYSICLDNRNTLVHSLGTSLAINPIKRQKRETFKRRPKRYGQEMQTYYASPLAIARIGVYMGTLYDYGLMLWDCHDCYYNRPEGSEPVRAPLPRRPPIPRRLKPLPLVPIDDSRQGGSSRA